MIQKYMPNSAALLLAVYFTFSLNFTCALATAKTYYVTPTANMSCPNKSTPCLTLSQYLNQTNAFFASSAVLRFILLPGNHSLHSKLSIGNVLSLTVDVYSADTSITCYPSAMFTFSDISIVSIKGLVLVGCTNIAITSVVELIVVDCCFQVLEHDGIVLELNDVKNASIVRTNFSSEPYTYDLDDSEIFHSFKTFAIGETLVVRGSVLMMYGCRFTDLSVFLSEDNGSGGVIYAELSNITIEHCTFKNITINGFALIDGFAFDNNTAGVMFARSSNIAISDSLFTQNSVNGFSGSAGVGILSVWYSNVTIINIEFILNGNAEESGSGRAMFAISSTIAVNNTTFVHNTVTGHFAAGGAIAVSLSNTTISYCTFTNNTVIVVPPVGGAGAVYAESSSILIMENCRFTENSAINGQGWGGAVIIEESNATIRNCIFTSNYVISYSHPYGHGLGGAVHIGSSFVAISDSIFYNNYVVGYNGSGGAIYAESSHLTLNNSILSCNTVLGNGGAIYTDSEFLDTQSNSVTIINCTMYNNSVPTPNGNGTGGAVSIVGINEITIKQSTFTSNSVNGVGGVAYVSQSSNVTLSNNTFIGNTASGLAGALYFSTVNLNSTNQLHIKSNVADIGSLYAVECTMCFSGVTTISDNVGSLYAFSCNLTFIGYTNFMNNSYITNTSQEGGAVTAIQSDVAFTGNVKLRHNFGVYGGAISSMQSKFYAYGKITIAHNTALLSGGGIYAFQSELNMKNHIHIRNNTAAFKGGGIYAISTTTKITDNSKTHLVGNWAKKGGGMCLEMNSKLYIVKTDEEQEDWLQPWINLTFAKNSAHYGGAVYISDDTNTASCDASRFTDQATNSTVFSECFIQGLTLRGLPLLSIVNPNMNILNTYFAYNSASIAGDVIYGGLLDRCTVNPFADYFRKFSQNPKNAVSYILNITNLTITEFTNSTKVSSDPVSLCFCIENLPDCSYQPKAVYVSKGEIFTVSLVAVDQVNNTKSGVTVHGLLPLPASLGEEQSVQKTNENGTCTELKYTVLSPHESEILSLYAEGPCMEIGISTKKVTVYIEPCPVGFTDANLRCECNNILYDEYISDCSVSNQTVLRKENVWFSYTNSTKHPQSYILHKHCPFDYCHPSAVKIHVNLNNRNGANAMCVFNRTGKLCGSCNNGFSLSLGSSRCVLCSNQWLVLLVVFTIAGIALVTFLLVCHFTVAAGTINGLLFYANVVSSNQATFFSQSTNKFFIVFIAWLNLDFGFETCFFNGLNAYWKTWLQFAFPAYVIILVILIIKLCDYSHRFARLIAKKNPIATLNTLVLLSYTKLLRTIISACQFTKLEYSDGKHEIVWLVDANVKFLEAKHIPLFVTALAVLIILMLYTILLFLWQWLLLCPKRQPVHWIRNSRLHGIMDAYFIAFNKNHRYWTGLLLLARVLLYIVSALNGTNTSDPRMNLLTISCIAGSLILWKVIIKGRIYRKWSLNVLDSLFLFNLLIFAITTFYVRDVEGNQTPVTSISVSIVFFTFMLIIVYHVYAFLLQDLIERRKERLLRNAQAGHVNSQLMLENDNTKNSDNDWTVSETVVDVPLIPLDTDSEVKDETATNEDKGNCSLSVNCSNGSTKSQSLVELKDFARDNNPVLNVESNSQDNDSEDESMIPDELVPLLS